MKREYVEKAAKEKIEDIVFCNICSEKIDNDESNYEAGRRDALYDFGAELFISGAKWRINSVWHSSKEIPTNKAMAILAMRSDGSCEKVFFSTLLRWRSFIKQCGIVQWAYIKDLMPNTKE